jgi:short subunit dehydrogenase-like uncharacterized protein
MENHFVLYGANGYTGELIARLSSSYGLRPLLAGRNESSIATLAKELNLDYAIADLENPTALDQLLDGHQLVLHAAGPFSKTAKQMVEACLRNKTHYIDINGDISCFELVKTFNDIAKSSDCMLMPGVGFDVVPTDSVAKKISEIFPNTIDLKLAFASIGSTISHGTATTMTEKLGEGGAKRVNGKIVSAPLGEHSMWIDFGKKNLFVMSIPWGDVSTAHHTTGIPNIETFFGVKPSVYKWMKAQRFFNWILKMEVVRNIIKKRIDQRPAGPDEKMRTEGISLVWGKGTNAEGESKTIRLKGPEGYTFTAHASLIIACEILKGNWKPGYQTPAGCYGSDLVLKGPGVSFY